MNSKLNLVPYLFCGLVAVPILAQVGGDPNTPPTGAPTAVYKTLDQVEPRTPLVDGAPGVTVFANDSILIDQAGSYYLTGNVEVDGIFGIRIAADSVTLDLRGFTVRPVAGQNGTDGIQIQASNVTVFNGHISGSVKYNEGTEEFSGNGFENGVFIEDVGGPYSNIRIRDLSVKGCLMNGIDVSVAGSTLVDTCVVDSVGATGIAADLVKNSSVTTSGLVGVDAEIVSGTRVRAVGSDGKGIVAEVVTESIADSPANAISGTKVIDNAVAIATKNGNGIESGGVVSNSFATSDRNNGILSTGAVFNSSAASGGPGNGITAEVVENCYVPEAGQEGVEATIVRGTSATGFSSGIDGRVVVASAGERDGPFGSDIVARSVAHAVWARGPGGIFANIGVACDVGSGSDNITNKYLAP